MMSCSQSLEVTESSKYTLASIIARKLPGTSGSFNTAGTKGTHMAVEVNGETMHRSGSMGLAVAEQGVEASSPRNLGSDLAECSAALL